MKPQQTLQINILSQEVALDKTKTKEMVELLHYCNNVITSNRCPKFLFLTQILNQGLATFYMTRDKNQIYYVMAGGTALFTFIGCDTNLK